MVRERIDPYADKDVMKLSRLGHMKRYQKALEYINNDSVVLDAGCGYGYGTKLIAKRSKKVTGVDPSAKAIRYAKKNFPGKNIDYRKEKLEDLNSTKVDVITCFEVLEHIEEPKKVLRKFRECLKQEGTLIISVPNGKNAPRNNPHHVRNITIKEMIKVLEGSDFQVEKIMGQYPILGVLSRIIRKLTGYETDTEKKSRITRFIDQFPLFSEIFSAILPGRLAASTSRTLYFVCVPSEG